jgi:hypothetical protein
MYVSPSSGPIYLTHNFFSTTPCRLFICFTSHTQHLPHLALLQTLSSGLRSRPSRPRSHHRNLQHSRPSRSRSQSGILWYLHPARWCILDVQQQREFAGGARDSGSGPIEPNMGCLDLQRRNCLPILNVRLTTPPSPHHYLPY